MSYLRKFHVNVFFTTTHGVCGVDTIFIMWQKRNPGTERPCELPSDPLLLLVMTTQSKGVLLLSGNLRHCLLALPHPSNIQYCNRFFLSLLVTPLHLLNHLMSTSPSFLIFSKGRPYNYDPCPNILLVVLRAGGPRSPHHKKLRISTMQFDFTSYYDNELCQCPLAYAGLLHLHRNTD